MKQNREFRSRPTQICSSKFWQKCRNNPINNCVFNKWISPGKKKKMSLDVTVTPYERINSKKATNLKNKTQNHKSFFQIRENPWDLGLCRVLRIAIKRMIHKQKSLRDWTFWNLTFALRKPMWRGWKDNVQTWRKYLQTYTQQRTRSIIHKEL